MPRPPTTLFEDSIDVPAWLEADRLTPYQERSQRDRDIGLRIPAGSRLGRARTWWREIAPDAGAGAGERLARLRTLLTLAMAALGAFAGVTLALAAFHYDGSQPVNVVRLLALLVGLQLFLLLLTLVLIPGRVIVLRGIQDLVAAINPASLAMSVFRRLAARWPGVAAMFDWHASRVGAGRFAKWQLLWWSQTAGVALNVGALATAIVLVTFTDLAFGWSTTLDADPARVARIVQAIAWPWHTLVPSAVPTVELVEQSQFFRLERGALTEGASRALTAWWPFTVLAIVTYGLLPRLALLVIAAVRLRAATAALLLDDPGVTALLDRMGSPEIATAAAEHDEGRDERVGPAPTAHPAITGTADAVIWEGGIAVDAARSYARDRLGIDVQTIVEAGGGHTLGADRDALQRIATNGARALLVFTPAWEPPLLELLDFLRELRRCVGDAASIVVTPVPDAIRAVTDVERDTWTRAMGRLRDPRLYVETGGA